MPPEIGSPREFLDEAEDVIPAAAVQADDVVFELEQDLIHLECRENGLDQHRAFDAAVRQIETSFREIEYLGPQPCLSMPLELR